MQFCLHRFQPRRHVECQLPAYRVAWVDVVEKYAVAGAIDVHVRARAHIVFPPAGIEDVLVGVKEGLRLAADVGDCDVQDRVLALRGVTEAISGVATDLACETDVMVNWNFPSRTGVPILATCGAAGAAFAGAAPLPAAGVPLLPPFAATEMMTIKTMNPARPRNVLRTQCRFFFGDCCGG